MEFETTFCPLIGEHITKVLNEEGITIEVVCQQYVKLNQGCLVKGASSDAFSLHDLPKRERGYCDFIGRNRITNSGG